LPNTTKPKSCASSPLTLSARWSRLIATDQHNVMQALEASRGENERGVAALMAKRR